jgi:hypothetical protein
MLQIFVYLSQHHPTCFLPIQKHCFTKVAAAEQQKHQHLVNEYKQYTFVMSISPSGWMDHGTALAYAIKVRCLYGEHVEEHIVNLGNILGTH